MRNYRDYTGEQGYGDERPVTTSSYNRPGSAHRSNSQKGLQNLNEESSGLARTFGKGQRVGGGEKKLHLGRGKNNRDEEELSSLSGFTASDREEEEEHEDQHEIKWSMAPKINKNKYVESDEEEEEEEEERDVVLKPHNDLQERFKEHDMMRRKGEQERQEQKILAARNAEIMQQNSRTMPLKRPNSSHGALKTSANMSRTFLNSQKENMNHHQNRPQTSYNNRGHHQGEEVEDYEERKPVTFKPVYTKTIRETLINKKVYNYSDKSFKTIAKKSDPVSRMNAFKNEWNKTKFLKANNQKKEGRKLNLAERNQTSKPDFIFHKYKSKYNMD